VVCDDQAAGHKRYFALLKLLNRGAFVDVFDLGDNTVLKAYRRIPQTHAPVRNWDDHEFIIRQLFAMEVLAYERLQPRPELSKYVPTYYGPLDEATLTLPPSSSGDPFVPGCALRLERIPGADIKIAHVPSRMQEEIEMVLEQIRDASGPVNVWDCSCFIPGPRSDFVVIDFALWDEWSDLQLYLEEHGHIPADVRGRVKLV